METQQDQYEKPLAIDLSTILPIYGGYCQHQSGAYYSDPDTDE
jgi:hypothetical protein